MVDCRIWTSLCSVERSITWSRGSVVVKEVCVADAPFNRTPVFFCSIIMIWFFRVWLYAASFGRSDWEDDKPRSLSRSERPAPARRQPREGVRYQVWIVWSQKSCRLGYRLCVSCHEGWPIGWRSRQSVKQRRNSGKWSVCRGSWGNPNIVSVTKNSSSSVTSCQSDLRTRSSKVGVGRRPTCWWRAAGHL